LKRPPGCYGAKCIDSGFEAATAANQTREPVRNEEERPFPAFKFGNELDEGITKINKIIFDIKS
jgi:hypothetical protein